MSGKDNVRVRVFVKINACRHGLRFLRVAASSNLGFLHVGNDKWTLSPAFDLNPFPDKLRESKTWLSEDTGPIDSIEQLLGQAAYFYLEQSQALAILAEVYAAVKDWRQIALSREVGLSQRELADFAPAFEHAEMEAAAGPRYDQSVHSGLRHS